MTGLIEKLLQPLVMLWMMLVVIMVFNFVKQQRRWGIIAALIVLAIWVAGATPLAMTLAAGLERPYLIEANEEYPEVDIGVVLGGIMTADPHEYTGLNINSCFDRMLTGIDLIKSEKAKELVYCGGDKTENSRNISRFHAMDSLITRCGIVGIQFRNLGTCQNTKEEADRVAEYVREEDLGKVGLVTSGFHMARAEAVFRSAGIDVVPIACDFVSTPHQKGVRAGFRLFPDQGNFELLRIYLHEKIGIFYYKLNGWVK